MASDNSKPKIQTTQIKPNYGTKVAKLRCSRCGRPSCGRVCSQCIHGEGA